jgi:hypothetical protein
MKVLRSAKSKSLMNISWSLCVLVANKTANGKNAIICFLSEIDKYQNKMIEGEYFIGIFDNNIASFKKRIYECAVK